MTKTPCVFAHNHYLCIVKRQKNTVERLKKIVKD